MKNIIWEVNYLSPPETMHYCKKCGSKTEHKSPGLFRVNAQQKVLDIWLIYRCVHCKTTWNLPIYSCINTKSIPAKLLERFTENDTELAWQYACDANLLKRNGAETTTPDYSITGEMVDFNQDTRIIISSRFPLHIKVSAVIRKKLSLSKKAFDEMASTGVIQLENGADILKCRVQQNITVLYRGICLKE